MKKTDKKTLTIATTLILLSVLTTAFVVYQFFPRIVSEKGVIPLNFSVGSFHATVTIEKDGQIILQEYHAGAVTKLGLNMTLAKLTGNSTSYNMTQYNLNNTFVSIGDQGTLNTDSTELPGEWNRTAGVQHDCTYNSFNITAIFYPDNGGPYTADCLGLNFEDGISNNALWGYDTFSESSGIDDTYTITIEIKVTAS